MKRLILLILLFFIAVAVSPFLINEKGYILIAMGDLTVESTVVTAGIMLVLLFFILLFTLKVVQGSVNLSALGWNKIAFAGQRRGLKNLNRGIAAFILNDHKQAEHLLAKAAEPSNFERIAYLLAATSAAKQKLNTNTQHYLSLLAQHDHTVKNVGLESILVTIQILIEQENYQQARDIIDEHHKHIGHDARLLGLEIELSLIEKRYQYVVEQLVLARKQKDISQEKITDWEGVAFKGVFNQNIIETSQGALDDYWQKLPRKVKQLESVVFAYCQVLAEQNITAPLNKIVLPAIKKSHDASFIKRIRTLPIKDADELIIAVQKHLHHDAHSAKWLSCLAHLAASSQQWDMAEKAFNSLVNLEGEQFDVFDLKVFAKVLTQQGELAKANQTLMKALDGMK